MRRFIIVIMVLVNCFYSCTEDVLEAGKSTFHFKKLDSAKSSIYFANAIVENDTLNYFKYPYLYLGAGVSTGDINNDGLTDIYFTGNLVNNKLYLNKGNLEFEDITETAAVSGEGKWCSGSTMVDINQDGFLDIYVSVSGKFGNGENLLYVNNGDNTFTERAASYGIADKSTSIQSTFFDYDNDGLLDLFVANYPDVLVSMGNKYYHQKMMENNHFDSGHLYRNNGNATFTDVTVAAGVKNFGLSLGVVSSDFNNDGLIDIYVSNDFNVPDYLYQNNGDGTFKEIVKKATKNTSMFGMGVDASDFNNDGLIDLLQLDMTAEDYKRAKTNMASMSPSTFYEAIDLGFHYQYMQNALQMNNGITSTGRPDFSNISRFAGLSSTDWSWGAVFSDFDNDGFKDVFITNGVKRDVNNNDVNAKYSLESLFGEKKDRDYTLLPSTPIPNYAFKNNGDLSFEKITKQWGLDEEGFSNGFSCADLDNDGDLDIILNNLDGIASIYINKAENEKKNFLRVKLKGSKTNPQGIGARVTINTKEGLQTQELTLTRGYQSSTEPILHFGMGDNNSVDSLHIRWPDGSFQKMENIAANQILEIEYAPNKVSANKQKSPEKGLRFFDMTDTSGIQFVHKENYYDDFTHEPLLPHRYSNIGPGVAVGDINADGLDDIFIGNAFEEQAKLFVQGPNGRFNEKNGPWVEDKYFEDGAAVFFDADNDGDEDLYVASSGYKRQNPPELFQDRLYVNVNGDFFRADKALPFNPTISNTVKIADFDNDGLKDIFVGGRAVLGEYPSPAKSIMLKNKGGKDLDIKFEDVTREVSPGFETLGMVTDAVWDDFNQDGKADLIIVGEWMSVRFFENRGLDFKEVTQEKESSEAVGWWYSIEKADLNNDGMTDLLTGNLGLNYKYKASEKNPFEVYANDFDENGSMDIVLSYKKKGQKLPLRGRECSSQQIPVIAKRFETYKSFANADLEEIYGTHMLNNSLHYSATTFESGVLMKNSSGTFDMQQFANEAQLSSINDFVVFDYNSDEYPDVILGGNLYESEVETPRNDSSIGLILLGGKNGVQRIMKPNETGLFLNGEVRSLEMVNMGSNGERALLVVYNSKAVKLLKVEKDG